MTKQSDQTPSSDPIHPVHQPPPAHPQEEISAESETAGDKDAPDAQSDEQTAEISPESFLQMLADKSAGDDPKKAVAAFKASIDEMIGEGFSLCDDVTTLPEFQKLYTDVGEVNSARATAQRYETSGSSRSRAGRTRSSSCGTFRRYDPDIEWHPLKRSNAARIAALRRSRTRLRSAGFQPASCRPKADRSSSSTSTSTTPRLQCRHDAGRALLLRRLRAPGAR